jgi:hypothetical protein
MPPARQAAASQADRPARNKHPRLGQHPGLGKPRAPTIPTAPSCSMHPPGALIVAAVRGEVQAVASIVLAGGDGHRQLTHAAALHRLLPAAAGQPVAALLGEVPHLAAHLAGAAGGRAAAHRALLLRNCQQALVIGNGGVKAAGGQHGLRGCLAPRLGGLAPAANLQVDGGRVFRRQSRVGGLQ